MRNMKKKIIISVAPTGNKLRKRDNPDVPVTPEEIAETLIECSREGASVAHVHVRDEKEMPSSQKELYQKVWDILEKENCPIIRQASLAGSSKTDPALSDILDTNTDMASLGMGSINYLDRVNLFEPDFIRSLAEKMRDKKIRPELEIFDVSMVDNSIRLQKEGLLTGPMKYNFILNAPGALKGTIDHLMYLVRQLPPDAIWGVTAMGKCHTDLIAAAISMGGHIRVGLEDTTEDAWGRPANNAEQVRWAVKLARLMGREPVSCEEARELLQIKRKGGNE